MAKLERTIAKLVSTVAEEQRKRSNTIRSGRVVEVDPAKGRVKVDVGDEGNPLVTPWVRWTERAGDRKTWNPPSVGELMTVLSQGGEISGTSLAVHGGFTDSNMPPSADGDALVFTLGSVTATVENGAITVVVGGVTAVLDGAGLHVNGGTITNDGTDVGKDHKHSGVTAGPAQTGTPV